MKKKKHADGFLAFRTPKETEKAVKFLCEANDREISEVLNYLCRIFLKDVNGIKSKFLNGKNSEP